MNLVWLPCGEPASRLLFFPLQNIIHSLFLDVSELGKFYSMVWVCLTHVYKYVYISENVYTYIQYAYICAVNWFSDTCIYVYIAIPVFISRFSLYCQPFFVCVKKWTNIRYSKIKRNIDFDSYNYSYNDWVWIMDLNDFEPLAYWVIESWLAIWKKKGFG